MKILVSGKMKNKKISLSYRMFILSMIKNIISDFDQSYFEEMFFYEGKKTKKTKPFTFSVFFKDYKINKDFVEVEGEVKIVISTPDIKLNMVLFNGFMKMKEYGDFEKTSVRIEKERKVEENEAIFKTLSPIFIKDANNKALEIEDENYNKELNYFANLSIKSFRGYGLKEEIVFTPLKMKKVVVKEEISGFKEKTNKKYIYFNSYSGVFHLRGDKDDLNLLKELGLGCRRNSGLGSIDLI
ncbi:CRISPR-associated endoribonuclease Cas6 [Clostridium perfringens]